MRIEGIYILRYILRKFDLSMGRTALAPIPGQAKPLPLKLPSELAIDLHAFCEASHGAPQTRVICAAVRRFIDEELKGNDGLAARFEAERERLISKNKSEPLKLLRREQPSGSTDSEV